MNKFRTILYLKAVDSKRDIPSAMLFYRKKTNEYIAPTIISNYQVYYTDNDNGGKRESIDSSFSTQSFVFQFKANKLELFGVLPENANGLRDEYIKPIIRNGNFLVIWKYTDNSETEQIGILMGTVSDEEGEKCRSILLNTSNVSIEELLPSLTHVIKSHNLIKRNA